MFANRFRCLLLNQNYNSLDKSIISVNIPSITTGTNIMSSPIKDIFYPGNSLEFSDLIIGFQLDEDYGNWKKIMDWLYLNKNFDSTIQNLLFSDISLQLGDAKKNIIYNIEFKDCFPFDISEINFNTKISDIEHLEFTSIFKINGLTFN